MEKHITLGFNAKITPIKPLNSEFTLCKCYVMALNKNRNLSYISKEAAEDAKPTIFNIPVIGHLYEDASGELHMGGHDMALVKNEDGSYAFKTLCMPFGVLPAQDNISYEDVVEPNGDTKTYLTADIILWTARFPELMSAIYDEKTYFGQSMEILPLETAALEEDKNYTDIKKFSYSGICLLGKSDNEDYHVEPCFPMSRVEPYSFSIDGNFTQLMEQLKTELALCFEAAQPNQGGNYVMTDEVRNAILAEFNLQLEGLNFEITADMTDEILRAKCAEFVAQAAQAAATTASAAQADTGAANTAPKAYSSTYYQRLEAIDNAVRTLNELTRDDDGNIIRDVYYWTADFDDKFAYVTRSEWVESDNKQEHGRVAYAFNEESMTATITGQFELMIVKWLTVEENKQIDDMRGEYQALVDFRTERLNADHQAAVAAVAAEFDDLSGDPAFVSLIENAASFANVEDLQEKCFALRGKHVVKNKSTKTPPRIPVGTQNHDNPYKEFFDVYGRKN